MVHSKQFISPASLSEPDMMAAVKISRIRFEHHPSGLWLECPKPRLSWTWSRELRPDLQWFGLRGSTKSKYDAETGFRQSHRRVPTQCWFHGLTSH